MDGYWHAWESWSDCSATCGYGNRNRSRICQQPLYEGAPCVGDESQTEGCNMFSCPGMYCNYLCYNSKTIPSCKVSMMKKEA